MWAQALRQTALVLGVTSGEGKVGHMPIRVLVADDHRLILRAVRHVLEATDDIEIVGEARRGSQVLPLLSQLKPDLCLLDVRMPEMDGLTCVERIRKASADVRIVMLSAADEEPERAEEAFARGADVYLSKSVDPRELPEALRRAHRGERFQLATMDATEQLDERAGLTAPRAQGPRGGRAWSREPGDQLGALDHRADREVSLDQHLSQLRRQQPHRGGALRVQPRHRRGLTPLRASRPPASDRCVNGRRTTFAARDLERSAEQAGPARASRRARAVLPLPPRRRRGRRRSPARCR